MRMKPSMVVALVLDPRAHRLHERYYYTQGTASSLAKLFVNLIVEYIVAASLLIGHGFALCPTHQDPNRRTGIFAAVPNIKMGDDVTNAES